jgi:glycosyltransferase involved in cell wall biosynthesis
MKVVHLTAGAGNMYCGSCLHANTLVAALRRAGADVLMVPLYTPLRSDEETGAEEGSLVRVAYGGINVYLQQRWAIFRHMPAIFDRWLDNPRLLRRLSKDGNHVRSEHLGDLTVSVLQGEQGRQRKELKKLVRWLEREVRPDIVHLSNVLLAGTARELSRRLAVPVVCTLSGEEAFLERIPEPHYGQARAVLRQRAGDLAALVALNGYSADFMARYLAVPRERIHVIPPGLNLQGHAVPREPRPARAADAAAAGTRTIGYLARVCPEKGLHQLAEAFQLLAADADLPPLRLHAAGYLDAADRPYLESIRSRLAACGIADRFTYFGELDRAAKITFLQSLEIMSVPAVFAESKGLSVLEAWANGVPVVLPAHGAFPEMVRDTGGGLLCQPHDAAALAAGLKRMIQDRSFATECGRRAQQAVHERYHADRMAQATLELYGKLCPTC